MDRNEVKKVAVTLNNPVLLRAFERFAIDGITWEEVLNEAVVELAKQNDYFLNKLIDNHTDGANSIPTPAPHFKPVPRKTSDDDKPQDPPYVVESN